MTVLRLWLTTTFLTFCVCEGIGRDCDPFTIDLWPFLVFYMSLGLSHTYVLWLWECDLFSVPLTSVGSGKRDGRGGLCSVSGRRCFPSPSTLDGRKIYDVTHATSSIDGNPFMFSLLFRVGDPESTYFGQILTPTLSFWRFGEDGGDVQNVVHYSLSWRKTSPPSRYLFLGRFYISHSTVDSHLVLVTPFFWEIVTSGT